MNVKYILYSALAVIFIIALIQFFSVQTVVPMQGVYGDYPHVIELDGNSIHVALADTAEARAQGLGGRTGLMSDEGMLFIFPADGRYAFWMRDMTFSIDILWLSSDGRVIYIVGDLAPSSYPKDFISDAPARYVLELPAGYVKMHFVKVGDIVRL